MHFSTLLPPTLFGIAEATHQRFQAAIDIIDDKFGPDYSKKNPHLVAAVLAALVAASQS